MTDTRVLIVGDGNNDVYAMPLFNAFQKICGENAYFFDTVIDNKHTLTERIQNRFSMGPVVTRLNRNLIKYINSIRPQLIFLYTTRVITARTIKLVKTQNPDVKVFIYNNDNPFSDYYPKYFWRHHLRIVPMADMVYAYRTDDLAKFKNIGANRVEQLRSYYVAERSYVTNNKLTEVPEVVFLGHYENDFRLEYIRALTDAKIPVGVPAKSWSDYEPYNEYLVRMDSYGKRYNEILNSCKIAIIFLSSINKDTYTRRCFEIPASGAMMLSVYTDDIAAMYEQDKEIVFFSSKEEFLEKINYYLLHDDERCRIAQSGHDRLMNNHDEVLDRAKQILQDYERIGL